MTASSPTEAPERPSGWAKRACIVAFCAGAVGMQAYFVARAYEDPHKHFGYQPFNESSTWRAELYRITDDGRRLSLRSGWHGYRWEDFIRDRGLGWPWALHHADSGVDSVADFLSKALNWVADRTPNDTTTRYLEAHMVYFRNRRGPQTLVLRSHERNPDGLGTTATDEH